MAERMASVGRWPDYQPIGKSRVQLALEVLKMPDAVEVKESFTVQSPAVVFGMFTEYVKAFVPMAERKRSELPALYAQLAEAYARVPGVQDSSGGLPGDHDSF